MFDLFKKFRVKFKCDLIEDYSNLRFSKNISYDELKSFLRSDLNEELIDPIYKNEEKSNKEDAFFRIYYNISKKYDKLLLNSLGVSVNLFVLESGFLGREYNKTPSMKLSNIENFNEFEKDVENERSKKSKLIQKETIFQILNGEGYFILENLNDSQDIKIIKIKPKSIVVVPKDYSFVIVNSSNDKLILLNLKKSSLNFDYFVLKKNAGATLYYTKTGFIRNENLSPIYHLEDFEENYLLDYNFEKDISLYKDLIKLPEKFNFLI